MAKQRNKRKPKNSRMRRTIMGTLSVVFMISAIIVALIPTPKLEAALDQTMPAGLLPNASANPNANIPDYSANIARYPVFADYEGKFRVAYGSNGGSFTGIMVGFDKDREIVGKRLSVPKEVKAFWYDPTLRKYIAVSADNNPQPLYYELQEKIDPVYDDAGALVSPGVDQILSLCTGETVDTWQNKKLYTLGRVGFSPSNPSPQESYVMVSQNSTLPTPVEAVQLTIPIQYIGSYKFDFDVEAVTYFGDPGGAYHTGNLIAKDDNGQPLQDEFGNPMVDDNGRQMEIGVFEGARNFDTLDIPDAILAVGNRAFYGCQMKAVNIADRTNSIGNYAFQKCNQLTSVTFVSPTNLREIGDYAFADCESLGSITIPDQVQKLGNFCFKNCSRLTAININGALNDGNTSLTTVGHGLFYNCGSLTQVVFPNNVSNIDQVEYTCFECKALTYLGLPANAGSSGSIFKATNVKGCNALETVKVPATDLRLECGDAAFTGAGYKNIYTGSGSIDALGRENLGYNYAFPDDYQVSENFNIKAYKSSYAYEYAQQHNMAFCYMDTGYEGWYEKSLEGYAFCVNEDNQLVRFEKREGDGKNVIIPDNIAGYHIKTISTQTFQGNTDMVFLYIPSSVETIEAGSFKDCSNLRTVYFDDVFGVQNIGAEAFSIQATKAPGDMENDGLTEYGGLRFIGKIDQNSQPYQYAMNTANNFNAQGVPVQYIKLCSAFPENLEVELVVENDPATNQIVKATPTLVGIPTLDKARDGKYSLSNFVSTNAESTPIRTSSQENDIAIRAYTEYINYPTKPLSEYPQEQAGVLSAIFNIEVPQGVEAFKEDIFQGQAMKSVSMESISSIPADSFKDCANLESFVMKSSNNPDGESIGKTAFQNCDKLTDVVLPATLSSFGSVPFFDCEKLTEVDFSGSPKYICDQAIIYELSEQGQKDKILEVLQARGNLQYSNKIEKDEVAGVSAIAPSAFAHCTGLTSVKLDDATIKTVPEKCFDGARNLEYCSLPESVRSIGDFAFRNTALRTAFIPNPITYIADSSFVTGDEDDPTNYQYLQGLTIQCPEDSVTVEYCNVRDGITAETYIPTYTVTFLDYDDYVLGTQQVRKGEGAEAPRAQRPGYTLVGWTQPFDKVYEDITTQAVYEEDNATNVDGYYSVVFQDFDGQYTWDTQWLKEGEFPVMPARTPERDGYKFSYWSPSNFMTIPVTGNRVVKAYYEEDKGYIKDAGTTFNVTFVDYNGTILDSQTVAVGTCPVETKVTPVRKGYTFTAWSPSNYASVPIYGDLTVTALYQKGNKGSVDSGNNSGLVDSDTSKDPDINSDNASNGNSSNATSGNTSNNTGNNTGNGVGNNTSSNKGNSSTVSGNTSGSSGTRVPTTQTDSGTKVEVTKSGISNRDLVTATVFGSNDNFVVKISDSDQARAEVEQALLAEYGTLDDLKFFAMDISLYDSTGTSKIENTNGITVTVTMPIPDVMAGYAGNNKAGAVKNGAFEKLGSRLITIDNVPCISFTATHFSPYAIYVETNHLTASDVSDVTPKTGDPIHPKWFLAIGLFLLSVLMFLGKGSKNKIVKVIE